MEYIFGRSGSGKTDYVFEKIKKLLDDNKEQKILLIVPEQSTFRMERKVIESLKLDGLFNMQVLSFDRLIHVLMAELGGRTLTSLDFIGKSMISRSVIDKNRDRLDVFSKSASKPGFEIKIAEVFSEFKRQDVDIDILKNIENIEVEQVTKQKIKDLSLLFDAYNNHISENKLDSEDLINIAIEKSKYSQTLDGAYVFVDGFDLLTSQLLRLLLSIIKKAKDVSITFTMNGKDDRDSMVFEPQAKLYNLIENALKDSDIERKIVNVSSYNNKKAKEIRHMERNIFAYPFIEYKEKIENIDFYCYQNKTHEVKGLCSKIIDLIGEGYRYNDIAVCISDMSEYETIIKSELKENKIPHFLDSKAKMVQTSFAEFVVSLLDFVQYKDVSELLVHLKSGFIDLDNQLLYAFENHIRKFNIKGYLLKYAFNNELDEFRDSVITPIFQLMDAIKNEKNVEKFGQIILDYFISMSVEENIEQFVYSLENSGDNENALIYSQVFETIIGIIEQSSLSFKDSESTFSSFVSAIKAGLEAAEIAVIPPSTDEVLVGDFARTVFPEVKVLLILGLNDGKIPSMPDASQVLTDHEKIKLQNAGINVGYRDRFFEERMKIYTVFSRPSEKLILSYYSSNSDEKPSVLIGRIKKIFPRLKINNIDSRKTVHLNLSKDTVFKNMCESLGKKLDGNDISDIWSNVFGYFENDADYSNRINGLKNRITNNTKQEYISNAYKLYERDGKLSTSISRVESYYRCPFKYFLDYGIRPDQNIEYSETSMDMGSFLHDCLNLFTKTLKKQNIRWAQIEDEQIGKICTDVIDIIAKSHNDGIFTKTDKYNFMLERLKVEFLFATKLVRDQLYDTDVDVHASEFSLRDKEFLKFELDDGNIVDIVCNIDRIDVVDFAHSKIVRIIDYKSNGKTVDFKEVYYGTNIQLIVYLNVLMKYFSDIGQTPIIGGAYYFDLSLPALENNSKENILKVKKMDGFIPDSVDVNSSLSVMDGSGFLATKGGVKKDGTMNKRTKSILTKEEFEAMFKRSEKLLKDAMDEIIKGNITPKPFLNKLVSPCEYCDYDSICLFDGDVDEYRVFLDKNKEDFLNA